MAKRKKRKNIDLEEQRYGLFMNENSFDLDVSYGEHYLESDVNYFVTLYKVNIIKSKSHKLYGQAKSSDKVFLPPVKLTVMFDLDDVTQEYLGGGEGGIVREDVGNLRFGIYLNELERKNTEIDRGDIIAFNPSGQRERFFEIESAQNVSDSTQQTIAGFKPYWKLVLAVPVKEDVTPFLKGDDLK
jgi:hypothetical protein